MALLDGIRVLACEMGLAGPMCSRLLGDLGAEVIKLERPRHGDVTRGWDTAAKGLASGFVWMNRGKKSVVLDLRDPATRPSIEALVKASDVFLVNLSPGWAESMNLDEPTVRELRGDIVYTEISGYGAEGPYADKNAYDLVVQGETGLIALTGTPEEPARISLPIVDIGAGSNAAIATLAALVQRMSTGEGASVSVAMFDSMIDWLGYYPHFWWHRHEAPTRWGLEHPLFVPYGPKKGSDNRYFNLAVLSAAHWRLFCTDVVDRPDLLADERYGTLEGRAEYRDELEPELDRVFLTRGADVWVEALEAAEIPCGLVREFPEVMEHPQLLHGDMIRQVGSPVGEIPIIASPMIVGGERPDPGAVPGLGEHTREVLSELGVSQAELEDIL